MSFLHRHKISQKCKTFLHHLFIDSLLFWTLKMVFVNQFKTVTDPTPLLPILEKRWPNSCTALTVALSYKMFKSDLEIFLFSSGSDESDTWIIFKWNRDDWNYWINVSPPLPFPTDGSEKQFKEALKSSGILNWRKSCLFIPSPVKLQKIVEEICSEMKCCFVKPYPENIFGMKPENSLKLEVHLPSENVRVGPLDGLEGVSLLVDDWPYNVPNGRDKTYTVVQKCIENSISAGVYVKMEQGEEELVCGAVMTGNGQVSMLYTKPEHRRKGYSKLCLNYIFKELGKQGIPACLGGAVGNQAAINLYKSFNDFEMVNEDLTFFSIEQTSI